MIRYHVDQSIRLAIFVMLSLNMSQVSFATPLGPNPQHSFEGHIDYQANAETLLRCDQPICNSGLGLGSSSYSCLALSESQFNLQDIPDQTPSFRLIYADLSWAASEGVNNQLDTHVTLTTPNGERASPPKASCNCCRAQPFRVCTLAHHGAVHTLLYTLLKVSKLHCGTCGCRRTQKSMCLIVC